MHISELCFKLEICPIKIILSTATFKLWPSQKLGSESLILSRCFNHLYWHKHVLYLFTDSIKTSYSLFILQQRPFLKKRQKQHESFKKAAIHNCMYNCYMQTYKYCWTKDFFTITHLYIMQDKSQGYYINISFITTALHNQHLFFLHNL